MLMSAPRHTLGWREPNGRTRVEASMLRSVAGGVRVATADLVLALPAGAQVSAPAGPPTAAQARAFVEEAEARLLDLSNRQSRADWVSQTFITDDTEKISAEANQVLIGATM